MKTRFIFFPVLSFLLVLSLIFWQCQKEEDLDVSKNVEYLSFAYDAAKFVEHFEQDDADFSGVILKFIDNELVFEKIVIKDSQFQRGSSMLSQPQERKVNFQDDNLFQYWNAEFELAYFSWLEISFIANNSELIYFSGAQVRLGESIHQNGDLVEAKAYFTFKMEGDFKGESKNGRDINDISNPMFSLGFPCPPEWPK